MICLLVILPLQNSIRCVMIQQRWQLICDQYEIPHRFEVFQGTIHAFLHYTRVLDDANDALEHGATFFRQQVGIPEEALQ